MRNKMFIIYILFILIFPKLYSVTIEVYALETMPYSGLVYGEASGLAVDILKEATNYGAPEFIFNFDIPWLRAQKKILDSDDKLVAIIPLTLIEERKENYKWIAPLFEEQPHLISYNRINPIKSLEEAKNIKIGVVRGHVMISILKNSGFTNIDDGSSDAKANALKLLNKRFDTIADTDLICIYNWKLIGQNPKDLQFGPTIEKFFISYIAGNLKFPQEVADSIANAIEQMKEDGKLEEIYNRWR